MTSYIEDKIHIAIVENLRIVQKYYPLIFSHIANQGRSPQEGAKLKKMGVEPGIPDLLLWWPVANGYDHGMMEIKAPGGKLSQNQIIVKQWAQGMKIKWAIADNVNDAMATFKCWGIPIRENNYIQPPATFEQKRQFVQTLYAPPGRADGSVNPWTALSTKKEKTPS